jgi:hypothetical protein
MPLLRIVVVVIRDCVLAIVMPAVPHSYPPAHSANGQPCLGAGPARRLPGADRSVKLPPRRSRPDAERETENDKNGTDKRLSHGSGRAGASARGLALARLFSGAGAC